MSDDIGGQDMPIGHRQIAEAMMYFEMIAEHHDIDSDEVISLACAGSYILLRFLYGPSFSPDNYAEIMSAAGDVCEKTSGNRFVSATDK